jgi:hypothetical protein
MVISGAFRMIEMCLPALDHQIRYLNGHGAGLWTTGSCLIYSHKSFAGLARPSPVAAQLLKQVTSVCNHEETSKEILSKINNLQQQCSTLHTTLTEVCFPNCFQQFPSLLIIEENGKQLSSNF